MADTIRTRSAIVALLPDNTSGDISPQDLRDFLVSVWSVYGALSVYNNASSQSFNTTPSKVTAWAIETSGAGVTVSASTDDITINTDGVFKVQAGLTLVSLNATTQYTFHIALNGVRVSGASASVEVQSANDVINLSIVHPVTCVSTDIISIYAESDDAGGQNATIQHGQVYVERIY